MKTVVGAWSAAAAGILSLTLDRYALINTTAKNAPRFYHIGLDSGGAIPVDTRIWSNDELMFEGSQYRTVLFDASGNILFGPQFFAVCGQSPIDLTRLINGCNLGVVSVRARGSLSGAYL